MQGKVKISSTRKQKTTRIGKFQSGSNEVKKGSIAKKSQKQGVYLANMKLQKKLVARSTEATERCMAQKAKNANGLILI